MQKIKKHHYELVEGLGGFGKPAYNLKLNGGTCISWAIDNFSLAQARMGAKAHVDQWIANLGAKNVTFVDLTADAGEEATPAPAIPRAAVANEDQVNRATGQYTQIRDRLSDLGYRSVSSENISISGGMIVSSHYLRGADGAKVIVRAKTDNMLNVLEVDVYKEVSVSNDWLEYFNSIN